MSSASAPLRHVDILIIGAGMAGASLAAEIGSDARVLIVEGEERPGYHSTGRSAAFWSETYGGPAIQPLTTASEAYLQGGGFLSPRGGLHLADAETRAALDALAADFAGSDVVLEPVGRDRIEAIVPGVRAGLVAGLIEPSCTDIDVGALHGHYLSRARKAGAELLCDAAVEAIARDGDGWRVTTRQGTIHTARIVDAAGAWASPVAALAGAAPIAITPYRRTVIQLIVDPPAPADLPLVMDIAETYYFKPEAGGRIWLSPHDETRVDPCDAAPEEIDVAIAIDRLEKIVDWRIVRREHAWAGLRSFAPDRAPVYGYDDRVQGFFWFAGQGGFGIQTAPAAAMIGAALLLGRDLPEAVRGIDLDRYDPRRFDLPE
jgi:D-arginine dehydrogenase